MNTQLQELYRQAGDAVEPTGDVHQILGRAQRRRTAAQVATPLATVAVVAGAVTVAANQPWVDDAGPDVAGGGGPESAAVAAALPEPATVAGNTYAMDERASTTGVPDSATLEITFRRGTYSAYAGCNTFQGRYDIPDGVLVASGSGSTAGFCPGAQRADRWLGSFLASGPEVTVDGDQLRLDNGDTDVSLAVRQTKDVPLSGTTWSLDSLVDGGTVSSVPHGVASTLRYDRSGELTVDAGCGGSTAQADIGEGSIDVTGTSYTEQRTHCARPSAAVGRTVRGLLDGSAAYEIDGDQLRIQNEDGGLVYTAN